MFVLYFTEIPLPQGRVLDALPELLVRLDSLGEVAYREGEELRVRVGPRSEHAVAAKTVTLRAGFPITGESSTYLPLSREATGTPGLFPKMTGELIIPPLDDRQTQVRFQGNYEPPFGALGALLDRTMLHRVAESSVKDLVDRMAAVLATESEHHGPSSRRAGEA